MRVAKAFSSISSSSWKSIARRVLPSRLDLNSPEGSFSEAPFEECKFHDALVRLACADRTLVRPHRDPWMRRLSPLPLLDHFGVSLFDQGAKPREGLAPPVAQFFDPCAYQLRWRLDLLRGALLHIVDVPLLYAKPRTLNVQQSIRSAQSSGRAAKAFLVFIYHLMPDTGFFHRPCMLFGALVCVSSPLATISFRWLSSALMTSSAVFPWNGASHGPPICLHVIVFIIISS